MYSKGQAVIWTGDGRRYLISAVHTNTQPVTYDIQLESDSSVKHYNVPEGDLHVADSPSG